MKIIVLAFVLLLSACGGGDPDGQVCREVQTPTTGMVPVTIIVCEDIK